MHTCPVVMNVANADPHDRGLVEHGIIEDDRRVITTQLQRHVRHVPCCHLHDPLTARGRTGETHMLDPRVADHDRAEHRILAGDHVQHPGRSFCATWRNVNTDDNGVVGGGLAITVFPAIKACGKLAARIANGQLNG